MRRSRIEKRHFILLEVLLWFAAFAVVAGTFLLAIEALKEDPDAVAMLGAIGLILTQTIALIGVLARKSSEHQTEERLRTEAALQAVGLIGSDETSESRVQASAAAVTLVDLGFTENALTLLQVLWAENRISVEAASQILDTGLRSEDFETRITAAGILAHNALKTYPESGPVAGTLDSTPEALRDESWWQDAKGERYSILVYLVRILERITVDRPDTPPEEAVFVGELVDFTIPLLALIKMEDKYLEFEDVVDESITRTAALLTVALLPVFRGRGTRMPGLKRSYEVKEVAEHLEFVLSRTRYVKGDWLPRIKSIEQWIEANYRSSATF